MLRKTVETNGNTCNIIAYEFTNIYGVKNRGFAYLAGMRIIFDLISEQNVVVSGLLLVLFATLQFSYASNEFAATRARNNIIMGAIARELRYNQRIVSV